VISIRSRIGPSPRRRVVQRTRFCVRRKPRADRNSPSCRCFAFYAHLYLGLYHEAMGASAKALHHLTLSAKTHTSRFYMGDLARMHVAMLTK
jgi:hypothetical protein